MSDSIRTRELSDFVSRLNSRSSDFTPRCYMPRHIDPSRFEDEAALPVLSGVRFRLIQRGLEANVVMEPRCTHYQPGEDKDSHINIGCCGIYKIPNSWTCEYALNVHTFYEQTKDCWYPSYTWSPEQISAKISRILREMCS